MINFIKRSKLDSFMAEANERFNAAETTITTLQGQLVATDERATAMQMRVNAAETSITTLQGRLTATDERATALQMRVDAALATITTLQGQLVATDERATAMQMRVNAAETSITTLQGRLAATNEQVTALQMRVDAALATITTLQGQLVATDERATAMQMRVNAAETSITTLQGRLAATNEQATALQMPVDAALTTITTLQGQVAEMAEEIRSEETGLPALTTVLMDSATHANFAKASANSANASANAAAMAASISAIEVADIIKEQVVFDLAAANARVRTAVTHANAAAAAANSATEAVKSAIAELNNSATHKSKVKEEDWDSVGMVKVYKFFDPTEGFWKQVDVPDAPDIGQGWRVATKKNGNKYFISPDSLVFDSELNAKLYVRLQAGAVQFSLPKFVEYQSKILSAWGVVQVGTKSYYYDPKAVVGSDRIGFIGVLFPSIVSAENYTQLKTTTTKPSS